MRGRGCCRLISVQNTKCCLYFVRKSGRNFLTSHFVSAIAYCIVIFFAIRKLQHELQHQSLINIPREENSGKNCVVYQVLYSNQTTTRVCAYRGGWITCYLVYINRLLFVALAMYDYYSTTIITTTSIATRTTVLLLLYYYCIPELHSRFSELRTGM